MSHPKKRAKELKKESPLPAASSSWMNSWERYWFGPVAAIRPYLLIKAVLLLLAVDLWLLRVPSGSRYGLDGFNVAHFQWLDALQPLPSPDLYVGLVLLTGWLAFVCVLISAGPWLLALLTILYTYTWAMSMIDGFQHHYFLSLVLTAFVFFPRVSAHDLYPHGAVTVESGQQPDPFTAGKKRVSSWGYVLLGMNMAVVYAFTALTKAGEAGFLTGQVIQRLSKKKGFFVPLEAWFTGLGVPSELFWQSFALGVIALEIFLAIAYLMAVKQDENRSRRLRLLIWSAFITAVTFHGIGNEVVLSLKIGWFSYYMIALACVYLLPESFLWVLGRVLTWPSRRLAEIWTTLAAWAGGKAELIISLTLIGAFAAAFLVAALSFALDLPGALAVGLLVALAVVSATILNLFLGLQQNSLKYLCATALAAAVMWTAVTQSTVRFEYYDRAGYHMKNRGNMDAALEAYEKALRYVPEWKRRNLDGKAAD